uniref:Uncharacterized protein n=1 Tax=Oryza meridionalis TaxID=40149 RepID=A0A0E0CJX6_9ORYZ
MAGVEVAALMVNKRPITAVIDLRVEAAAMGTTTWRVSLKRVEAAADLWDLEEREAATMLMTKTGSQGDGASGREPSAPQGLWTRVSAAWAEQISVVGGGSP